VADGGDGEYGSVRVAKNAAGSGARRCCAVARRTHQTIGKTDGAVVGGADGWGPVGGWGDQGADALDVAANDKGVLAGGAYGRRYVLLPRDRTKIFSRPYLGGWGSGRDTKMTPALPRRFALPELPHFAAAAQPWAAQLPTPLDRFSGVAPFRAAGGRPRWRGAWPQLECGVYFFFAAWPFIGNFLLLIPLGCQSLRDSGGRNRLALCRIR